MDSVTTGRADPNELQKYFEGRKYIILNYVMKDGRYVADFYPISEESFANAGYFEISKETLQADNPVLFNVIIKQKMFLNDSPVRLLAVQKPGNIEFIPTSALNFSEAQALQVKGGLKNPEEIQFKPKNAPAFFGKGERGIYLINADSKGNPAGHFPAN